MCVCPYEHLRVLLVGGALIHCHCTLEEVSATQGSKFEVTNVLLKDKKGREMILLMLIYLKKSKSVFIKNI